MTTTTGSRTIQGDRVCPDLGLEGNPAARSPFPTPLHRCFAGSVPVRLEAEHQSAFCLSGAYLECDRRSAATRILARHETSAASRTGFRIRLNRLPLRTRTTLTGVGSLVVVGLLALGIRWIPSWAGMGPMDGGSVTEPSVAAAPSPLAVAPNPTSTPGTAVPGSPPSQPVVFFTEASATPTAMPTPSATPLPLPSATPEPKTYVVQAGDNLWRIATDNGTTVDDLMRANGLVDRGKLDVGQRLVIPTPTPRPSPTPQGAAGTSTP